MKDGDQFPEKAVLMQELLTAIVGFIATSGMRLHDIEAAYRKCIAQAFDERGRFRANRKQGVPYGCDTVAGAVLRAWHRNPKYIDRFAQPRPLSPDGRTPNILTLIRSQSRSHEPKSILESMLAAKLIRKCRGGGYLPARPLATIAALNPLAIDHVAKTVMRLVETASRNMLSGEGGMRLIERYAHIPNLDGSEAQAFAVFSRQQGQACIDAVEDWLEARQVSRPARRATSGTMNAGVHVFAFLGESKEQRRSGVKLVATKRPTPPREARV